MSPLLKLALEIGPLAIFFIVFSWTKTDGGGDVGDIDALIWATAAFMASLAASTSVSYALTRKISKMTAITAVVVLVMGGMTIWLRDPVFIQMKPTIVNVMFAGILGAGLLQGQSYLKIVMGELLPMRDEGWMKLTRNWAWFFVVMAVFNEAVWRLTDAETWVAVKTFVYLPVTVVFTLSQTPLMAKYAIEEEVVGAETDAAGKPTSSDG